MRARRQQLSAACRAAAAHAACRRLVSLRRFTAAKHIALYLAVDGELDPLPVLEQACAMGKQCYLPVLHPVGHRRLWFAAWQPGDALRANSYNILEPEWLPSTLIKPWALDLVVVPLVAFDHTGKRLGMGGGYYDRSFAWRKNRNHWNGPLLVGYGYELQKIRHISVQPWDVAMDAIVTESTLYMR
ncbi:5-formyltetrahydrofolate cyclo-ligase [Thiolapillus sp.]